MPEKSRKKLTHVALEHVAVTACELLAAVQRTVGALTYPVGIGIDNEGSLEDRLNDVAEGVMDNPVTEWGSGDETALGLVDVKRDVGTETVGSSR